MERYGTINKQLSLLAVILATFGVVSQSQALGQQIPSPGNPGQPSEPSKPQEPSEAVETFVPRKPKSDAAVFYVKNNFTLKKEDDLKKAVKSLKGSTYSYNSSKKVYTWDLKGGILDGKNQKGDGGQSEDQEPLARVRMPLIIKNGFIRNNKNALTFYVPNSGVEKVTWLTVGEDAVATSNGAYDFTIRNCEAINKSSGDKSFQFNEANGLVAENNTIYRGRTGMRIGDSKTTQVSEVAYVSGNRFIDVDTAYHLSKITVKETGTSKYEKVRLQWKLSNGAKRTK